MRISILLAFMLVYLPISAQTRGATPCATGAQSETSHWRVYIDREHHFCFRYPKSYVPIPHPRAGCRGPKLEDKKRVANIGVCVLEEKFQPDVLVRMAPTGIDSPPKPIQIGENTFYYYGPGGGGVDYPDVYYFDLGGKILGIDFDGPYENEKTPTPATKQMEQRVLKSFQEF
jgi:hypothetical protein